MPPSKPSHQHPPDHFPTSPAAQAALTHLSLVLFPAQYSAPFLASCLAHWLAQPAPAGAARWTEEALVERVCEKLLEEEETGRAGRAVGWLPAATAAGGAMAQGGIAEKEEVRRRWARAAGKGKEREIPRPSAAGPGGGKTEDVTLARNLALIRLHALFPLVPIVEIRVLLLSLEHTFLHQATEELLLRSEASSASSAARKNRDAVGVEVVDLAEVGRSVLSAFRSLFQPAASRRGDAQGKARATSDGSAPLDPVLTPHDLFRPPSHNAALIAHFTTLFPAFSAQSVRRAVEEEGGSYPALRARFEVEAAERAARVARAGGGRGKWWTGFGLFSPQPLSSSASASGDASPSSSSAASGDVQRELAARRLLRDPGANVAAAKEVEAYYASLERPSRPRRVRETEQGLEAASSPSTSSSPEPTTIECQCCFTDVPLLPSSSLLTCDAPSPSARHAFCPPCLRSYAHTFLSGGSPLPPLALSMLALPCFAAASTAGGEPCPAALRAATLRRALDRRTVRLFERRSAEANLEALVSGGEGDGGAPAGGGVRVHRCPFCPYGEIAPPSSSASSPSDSPLARVFLPAWTTPWPPAAAILVATLLGLVALAVFALAVGVFALLCPVPVPRLEKVYAELYPALSPTPAPAADDPPQPATLLPLPLSTSLLLSPHHLPALSLSFLRGIAARVVRRKEGKRTVFRCRNFGRRGGLREREWWLERLEGVGERVGEWMEREEREEEEGEGEGGATAEEVEERRREKLVQLVWGGDDLTSSSSSSSGGDGYDDDEEDEEEERETDRCGRLSCLLCSGALNPSAPSLHTCHSSPLPSSFGAPNPAVNEKERAEESLRLAVEAAMSAAVARRCDRCGAGVVKEGGCNKVTCRCGAAYCWACREAVPPSVGYRHFCQHFLPDPSQGCTECSSCSLWKEGDEKERVREAAAAARRKWVLDHPDWAKKVDVKDVVVRVGPPAALTEGHPLSEELLNSFEQAVERVVSFFLLIVPLSAV
ncbi:hypothetical protein JCM6882_006034 [Rhodosporidiobolus microsporus]